MNQPPNSTNANANVNAYNVKEDFTARWGNESAVINSDALTIHGHPVMESWESPYMCELARVASGNGGRVLEVGFGMGIASGHLQSFDISEHVIIEANKDVFKTLIEFSRTAKHKIIPILGLWEDVVPLLGDHIFDGILYDTYPTSAEKMHVHQFDFIRHAHRLLKSQGVLSYCNLTSWGNLRKEHDCTSLFEQTQVPHIRAAGFNQSSMYVIPVNPPATCEYYSFPDVLVPCLKKD